MPPKTSGVNFLFESQADRNVEGYGDQGVTSL